MTQTIDQRARELLNKHLKSGGLSDDGGTRTLVHQRYVDAAEAALSEALTRIEQLEGNLESALIYLEEAGLSRASALIRIVEPSQAALDWVATLTKGIKG